MSYDVHYNGETSVHSHLENCPLCGQTLPNDEAARHLHAKLDAEQRARERQSLPAIAGIRPQRLEPHAGANPRHSRGLSRLGWCTQRRGQSRQPRRAGRSTLPTPAMKKLDELLRPADRVRCGSSGCSDGQFPQEASLGN